MDDRTVQLLDSLIKIAEMTLGDSEYKRGAIETLTGLRDALTPPSSSSSSSVSDEDGSKTVCIDCGADEGTLLKEFDPEKDHYCSELLEMTPVCACCGSENLSVIKEQECDNEKP